MGIEADKVVGIISEMQSGIAALSASPEQSLKLKAANSGTFNPSSYASLVRRTGKPIEELAKALSERSTGKNNGFYGKSHTPEVLAASAAARANQFQTVTRPEVAIWGMLQALGVAFERQKAIGQYVVDFLISKTVVEVFGNYWHSDRMKSRTHTNRHEQDLSRVETLTGWGYRVVVIWESEIFLTPQVVVERLRALCV